MSQSTKSKSDRYRDWIERVGLPMRIGLLPLRAYHFLQRKRREFKTQLRDLLYIYAYTPLKVFQIRHKRKIKVLFVLTELGPWKTELLYRRMLGHERFSPVLGLSASAEYEHALAERAKTELADYCISKGYEFFDLDVDSSNAFPADIIFYQKPAEGDYKSDVFFYGHLNALFCYALYGFHSVVVDWQINLPLFRISWQNYFENDLTKNPLYEIRNFKRDNMVVTGLPMSDALVMPKIEYADPWKKIGRCKRIIYAPHCTISDQCVGVNYSTFLEYAEDMRKLVSKYKGKVQWAFKPHPLLYPRLVRVWGKEKSDAYYNYWRQQENTQLATGEYAGLFMHSDAMIHDCGSFTIEYHYTGNPVIYLLKDEEHESNLNVFARKAFDLHYKGRCLSDIESFIEDLIVGNDPKKNERKQFYADHLLPPHGKMACDNIIDSILGKNGYK